MSRGSRLIAMLLVAIFVLGLLSLVTGRGGTLLARPVDAAEERLLRLILWELRLPRLLLAVFVGASLGLAGAVLQGLTRNPLAEPGLLGTTSGAALGAVIAIYTGLGLAWSLSIPLLGLAGAFVASALTLALGGGGGVLVLILAGAAVSGLMLAGTALALNLSPNPYAAYEITQWMMGSLTDRSWHEVWLAAPFVLAGGALLLSTGRSLDALSLGELQAASLGVDLPRLRRRVLLGTALAVGAATAVTGAIGFIGLLAPHLVRARVGHEPGRVLWPASLCGAVLLLASDLATRVMPLQPELKLGVLTALIGAPFFLWLVWRMKKVAP